MKTKIDFKQSFIAGLKAAGAASILNAILFFIFHQAGIIVDTIFIKSEQSLTVFPIVMASIIPALIASMVFFLLEKFTQNGFKIFRILSIILMVLSFLNPFMGIPGVTVGYAVALNLMHVTVVAALLYFIGKKASK